MELFDPEATSFNLESEVGSFRDERFKGIWSAEGFAYDEEAVVFAGQEAFS